MEKYARTYFLFFDEFFKFGNERRKETVVFFARGGGVPPENSLFFAADFRDYLRGRLRAPLREEMRKFEIFYTVFFRGFYPPTMVSSGRVKIGVRSILMPFSAAVAMKFSIISQCFSENAGTL